MAFRDLADINWWMAGTLNEDTPEQTAAYEAGKPLPQSPVIEDASKLAKSKTKDRRLAASRSQSIYTSPLGIGGQAQVARKQLLGQ